MNHIYIIEKIIDGKIILNTHSKNRTIEQVKELHSIITNKNT